MEKRIRVGILCGGESAEHEVSLQSAKNIFSALSEEKFDKRVIGIDKRGRWHLLPSDNWLENQDDPKNVRLNLASAPAIAVVPGSDIPFINLSTNSPLEPFDVIIPVLHGPMGEDGTVQGLLKLARLPFVGPDVLGSALGMDKDAMKRILRDAGIPIARFRTIRADEREGVAFSDLVTELGLPLFIKPANMGSSVGVSRADSEEDFKKAVEEAFRYDSKVLVEEYVKGREVECSVLGNEEPRASVAGEIIPSHSFYSYEAKYIDSSGAALKIPAAIPGNTLQEIQALSLRTFKALCCEGLGRVDFFLKEDGSLLVNEINTIPGFTKISMYPKMWEASGLGYAELLERLINLALSRHERDMRFRLGVQ